MEPKSVLISDIYTLIAEQDDKEMKEILDSLKEVFVQGWVRTNRDNGSVGFIALNDGSCFKNVQLVYDKNVVQDYDKLSHVNTGAALSVVGELVLTPQAKQPFEIQVKEFELTGSVDPDYPLQKKAHSMEFLREIAHLRPRANTFNAVFRMPSASSTSMPAVIPISSARCGPNTISASGTPARRCANTPADAISSLSTRTTSCSRSTSAE